MANSRGGNPGVPGALIVGGTLLGILALVAWASPSESSIQVNRPPPPPPPPPRPPGPTPVPGSAEAIAAAVEAALGGAGASERGTPPPAGQAQGQVPAGAVLPNPAPLMQGRRYKARLELSGLESLASRETVKNQFESLGFANVVVYMSANELPPGWPQLALANATSRSRWAEGTWNQPSQSISRPPQIQNAWTA